MSHVGLFVTARATSTRLAGKALLTIGNQSVLEHLLDRALLVRTVSRVVLCTSTEPEDDALEAIASRKGVAVHRGPLRDKFQRWLGASAVHGVERFIEVDGDDLFCDPELMEHAVAQMRTAPCDLLELPPGLIVGAGAVCVDVDALGKVAAVAPPHVDDTWRCFRESGTLRVDRLNVHDPIFFTHGIRLTLDYVEDLEFFRAVFRELPLTRNTRPLREIVAFLRTRPDLTAMNWHRQEDYLQNRKHVAEAERTTDPAL